MMTPAVLKCNARTFLHTQASRERVLDRVSLPRTPASSSKSSTPTTNHSWQADMDARTIMRPGGTHAGMIPPGIRPVRTHAGVILPDIWSVDSIRVSLGRTGVLSGPAGISARRTFVSVRRPQDQRTTGDSNESGPLRRAFVAGRMGHNERAHGWADTAGDSQERQGNQRKSGGSPGAGLPLWLTAFGKSVLFVIPSILFWAHFLTSGFYPVSEQELAEERAETRRLYHFFAINESTPEPELDVLWNAKVIALSDLSARLVKSPNMTEILGCSGVEVNHVLSPPPPEGSPDTLLSNEAEWTPRLIFSSASGIVFCYARFLLHDEKWIPMEVNFVDANLHTVGTQVPLWKMEGKQPHGVMYQRMPPKPSDF
eukprot:GEMP01071818.1.p1 GENE.GEMP01071818.1~~GEMP01071818.1.p1  ORF type:complete len:392 (-),score=66.47 GEMP01071818.1:36-1145(-)